MGKLNDWVNQNSQYLKLGDGDSYSGIYKGYEFSTFRDKEVVNYKIDDKTLTSSSKKLAEQMDKIAPNTKITITKTGSGTDTKYSIKTENEVNEEIQDVAWDD